MKVNADALRHLRERTGLTQVQLGAATNLPKWTINRLEHGVRPGTPSQIKALASALGVPINAITTSVDQ